MDIVFIIKKMKKPQKDKYGGPERRRYPRLPGTLVEYFPIGEIAAKKTSFTENISPVGVRLLVDEEIKINALLSLKIYLPGSKDAIEAKGRIVWTRLSSFLSRGKRKHYDLGMEFVEIDESDREKIWQYVAKHLPRH